MGRAGDRAAAARRASAERMRRAATHLRDGAVVHDTHGSRRAAAALLEHLADQELAATATTTTGTRRGTGPRGGLDVHTLDRAGTLADRVLAGDPAHALHDARPLPLGYDNGTRPSGHAPITG